MPLLKLSNVICSAARVVHSLTIYVVKTNFFYPHYRKLQILKMPLR